MATYRPIQISFWQDKFVLKLTPEQKYFYLYLMTNTKTKQCGIYELPKNVICFETGYNDDTVNKLIQYFIESKKIVYDKNTEEIFIINWIKYNQVDNKNIQACVLKEIKLVKSKQLLSHLSNIIDNVNSNELYNNQIKEAIPPLVSGLQYPTKPLVSGLQYPAKKETETKTEAEKKSKQQTEAENKSKPKEEMEGFNIEEKQKPVSTLNGGTDHCFNKFWKFYNRREGDQMKVREAFKSNILCDKDFQDLIKATRNYNDLTRSRELEYVMMPINFLEKYKDFINVSN